MKEEKREIEDPGKENNTLLLCNSQVIIFDYKNKGGKDNHL